MRPRQLHKGPGIVVVVFFAGALLLPILQAAELKPVLTVSTANPETLYRLAERIAALVGTPEDFRDVTRPYRELKGMAPKNPLLFVLYGDNEGGFQPLIFLPIDDFNEVEIPGFDVLRTLFKKEGEKLLVDSPMGTSIVTQKKGYLVFSPESSDMPIPDDPSEFLKGLELFSLGVRLDTEHTSADAIQGLLAPIKRLIAVQVDRDEMLVPMFEQLNSVVERMCEETRSITCGLTMDMRNADVSFRTTVVARPDSKAEKELAFLKNARSKFGGFLGDDNAVISLSSVKVGFAMPESQIDQLFKGILELVGESVDAQLAHTVAASAKKILLAIAKLTEFDFGCSLSNDGTFALGMTLAESKELEKIGSLIRGHLEKPASDDNLAKIFKKVKINYDSLDGFQLSSVVLPLKEHVSEKETTPFPRFLATQTLYVYWGIKDDAFVLMGGFNPKTEDIFKAAIDAMKNPVGASGGGSGKFSMWQLGVLMQKYRINQLSPMAGWMVQACIGAGPEANITLVQDIDQTSVVRTIWISGRIWQTLSRIVAGVDQSTGPPSRKIRDFL